MLKGIDPILSPDILHALSSMGHGDEVAIVDSHYPALAASNETAYGKLLRMDGADTGRAFKALLSVLETDHMFVSHPVERMEVDGKPDDMPIVQKEAQAAYDNAIGEHKHMGTIKRMDYYGRAKKAFCIIITGETRGWGCFIIKKGLVVTPDQPALAGNSTVTNYNV